MTVNGTVGGSWAYAQGCRVNNEFLLGGTKLVVHGDMAATRDFSAGIVSLEPYYGAPH